MKNRKIKRSKEMGERRREVGEVEDRRYMLKRKNKTLQDRVGLGRGRVARPPCGSATSVEKDSDSA